MSKLRGEIYVCENSFCIYQSKRKCTLNEEIEIDISGFAIAAFIPT